MMKEKLRKELGKTVYDALCVILACEMMLVLLAANLLFSWDLQEKTLVCILVALIYGLFRCAGVGLRRMMIGVMSVTLAICITAASISAGWLAFSRDGKYEAVDSGKASLYADKQVMVIVPHQDDDINLLGGVIEEYVKYGSELRVVFVTNGDYDHIPEVRYWEAIEVLGTLGIPEDNLIFLGYGDQYAEGMPHIYNAPEGEVVTSYYGKTQTYGSQMHPAYREGRDYTIEHLMEDLQNVILEYRPDVLFCSDYDVHVDHKAVTLLFDKVMGMLLKEHPDYRPTVYKGYAYYTAWIAEDDYYTLNIASTKNPFEASVGPAADVYRWEDRVRFPVDASGLSRSMVTSDMYQTLLNYASQNAQIFAGRIINGDRVFWLRRTDSLCMQAQIRTSSGDADLLNDFMLIENSNLLDTNRMPYDGVWSPLESDAEKKAEITLAEPSDLYSIVLYDHPSPKENVTGVEICFDDGTKITWDNLEPDGSATQIPVNKENVCAFEIRILSGEGVAPGLSEIEAFAGPYEQKEKVLKLMDQNGNFVYDYWTERNGTAILNVYSYGDGIPENPEELTLVVEDPKCEAYWESGSLHVHCPKGRQTLLQIQDETGTVSDQVLIRNPGGFTRMAVGGYQWLEKRLFDEYNAGTFSELLELPAAQWAMEKMRIIKYYLL